MFANARIRIAAAIAAITGALRNGPEIPMARAPGMGRRRAVPARSYGSGRLIWDSASKGTAYKVLDPKSHRMVYVPLSSVPMNMRRPRQDRRRGFTV